MVIGKGLRELGTSIRCLANWNAMVLPGQTRSGQAVMPCIWNGVHRSIRVGRHQSLLLPLPLPLVFDTFVSEFVSLSWAAYKYGTG